MAQPKIELVADQDYLPALLDLLSKAKKEINLMAYSFAIGSTNGKHTVKSAPYEIASKLVEIKKKFGKKIRIRFYVEGVRDTSERNSVTAKFLKAGGVEVKFGATHAKGFSVDGKYVLFGSTNLTHQSITRNREANVLIRGTALTNGFNAYFEHLWDGGKHGDIHLKAPYLADGDFKDELIALIDGAKKRIDFSIYFFNQRDIEKALILAFDRGVKVTGFVHQHGSFALSYIYANRRTVQRLHDAGLENIVFSRFSVFFHSKYLIVDGKEVMLGTGNWLNEDVNIHPQLYFHVKDPGLAKKFIKHLNSQIKVDSI